MSVVKAEHAKAREGHPKLSGWSQTKGFGGLWWTRDNRPCWRREPPAHQGALSMQPWQMVTVRKCRSSVVRSSDVLRYTTKTPNFQMLATDWTHCTKLCTGLEQTNLSAGSFSRQPLLNSGWWLTFMLLLKFRVSGDGLRTYMYPNSLFCPDLPTAKLI